MRDQRADSQLTDRALDQQIEDLLAVEPAPEFVATVRARVAAEPAPGGWRFGWWPLAVGAPAAAAIVLVVTLARPALLVRELPGDTLAAGTVRAADIVLPVPPAPVVDGLVATAAPAPPPAPPAVPAILPETVVRSAPRPAPASMSPSVVPPRSPDPRFGRVVISRGEAAALRHLFAQVRDRRVWVPPPAEPPGPVAALAPLAEIVIQHITVEPVTLALIEEGALQ